MSSFLAKMSTGARTPQRGQGVIHYGINKAERYSSAAVFGFIKGYYRERALIAGKVPVDLAVGLGSTLLSAGLMIFTGGRSKAASHLDAVGDSGMASWFNSLGAMYGVKKSGRKVYVLDQGAAAPAALPPGMTAVGALPQAVGGAYLSDDQIAHYANPR